MRFSKVRPSRRGVCNFALASSVAALTAACSSTDYPARSISGARVDRGVFTESAYGVRSSRRVVTRGPIPTGGGHYKVGNPYKVAGRWYVPREDRNYDRIGISSWYGDDFHGRRTSNGEIFDRYALTAAHPTLPLPSYAYVTNLRNRRTILVRVNDRGPYVKGRIIDLSHASAKALGFVNKGSTRVRVRYAGRAPLNGNDRRERRFLAAQRDIWSGKRRAIASMEPLPPPPAPPRRELYDAPPSDDRNSWSPTAYRAALAGKPEPKDKKPDVTKKLAGRLPFGAFEPTAAIAPAPEPYALAGPTRRAITTRRGGNTRAFVQIGLYRDMNDAERLRREFGHLGPIEVAPFPTGAGTPVYRVRLGPMTPVDAESAFRQVAGRGVTGSAIVFE